ncbi:hypothetical protein VNI00_003182 [Paramarasmius palmivorus]|uniref:Uncharacterized protein n=1 Tax=Paramarasmius palmivorus TaxID=297713 RepID=A0AAW0DT59_9AGAR
MAHPATRSPSRGRECSRPPCLVTSNSSASPHRQRTPSLSRSPNALPNPILVVETHLHAHLHPPASPTLSSDGASSGTKSPLNRSPTIPYNAPSYISSSYADSYASLSHVSSSPSANSTLINNSNGKDKDKDPKIVTIPLRACCTDCFHITEECLRTGNQWEERFSKGARRRRGSSVSSSSGASMTSEEGELDPEAAMYSPMAHYKPLKYLETKDTEANPSSNSDPVHASASTSAICEEDEPEVQVNKFAASVAVDEVESIRKRKGKFKNWEAPLRADGHPDYVETEDELDVLSRKRDGEREREVSTSSTSTTHSSISATSSTSATSYNSSAPDVSLVTKDFAPASPTVPIPIPGHVNVIPPPTSYSHVKTKRRRKPATPIKEDEEPDEKESLQSSSRSKRYSACRLRRNDDDEDANLLFPLPSPRRSPNSSPLSTPGSQTPMNGSKTPSPNGSLTATPMSSSSQVQLHDPPVRRREKSKLGPNCERISPASSSSSGEGSTVESSERAMLPESLSKKYKHQRVPSLKAAATVAAAARLKEGEKVEMVEDENGMVVVKKK